MKHSLAGTLIISLAAVGILTAVIISDTSSVQGDTARAAAESGADNNSLETIDTLTLAILGADTYSLDEIQMPTTAFDEASDDSIPDADADLEDAAMETSASDDDENEYSDLAIANVTNYVNIRSNPTTDSEVVGKIYNGSVAQILSVAGDDNDWFKVVSGNAEGYIKSEFFIYGDSAAAVIDNYVTYYAVVLADRLNVREEPDKESQRIGYIDNGEKVRIIDNQGEWLKVEYTTESTGYVASEYVTITEDFIYAKTIAEEQAELEAMKALEERENVSEEKASEDVTITVTSPAASYSSNTELRNSIVEYSMQFLGNKYVHGGQSLITGTDCSGFTSLIYAQFGYSLSRTPSGQLSGNGRSISYSEIQPGDIICYGSNGKCTHVALYIGNGQIIHSANSKKGVIISKADYDTILGVKNIID